jgi:hypothetical protein
VRRESDPEYHGHVTRRKLAAAGCRGLHAALGLAVLLGGAGVAGAADNTGSLMRQLREDTSYKVRLSAALQLG